MLFHSQLAPNSGAYIEHSMFHMDDPTFNSSRFIQVMQQVVDRHDNLGAAFHTPLAADPLQVINKQAMLPVTQLDWRGKSEEDSAIDLAEWVAVDRATDFDLTQAPLLRLALIQRYGQQLCNIVYLPPSVARSLVSRFVLG